MRTLQLTDAEFRILQAMNSYIVNTVADEDIAELLADATPNIDPDEDRAFTLRVGAWVDLGAKLA
jgi:hypothetical protein